jgi:hypothetical protein
MNDKTRAAPLNRELGKIIIEAYAGRGLLPHVLAVRRKVAYVRSPHVVQEVARVLLPRNEEGAVARRRSGV